MPETQVAATPSPEKSTTVPMAPSIITPMKQRGRGISLNLAVSPASPVPNSNHHHSYSNSSISNGNHSNNSSSVNTPTGNHVSNGIGGSSTHHRRSSSAATLPQLSESPLEELKYDLPLPENDKLTAMDIDEQLRLLAFKEMSVVEIKDHIGTLQNKLKKHEEELHRLREVIQRTLYKEMGGSTSNNTILGGYGNSTISEPREAAVRSTRRRSRTLSFTGSSTSSLPISEEEEAQLHSLEKTDSLRTPPTSNRGSRILPSTTANGAPGPVVAPAATATSSLWSNLSKPLNLIQQFDTMLQNEFEKSLIPQSHLNQPAESAAVAASTTAPHQQSLGQTDTQVAQEKRNSQQSISRTRSRLSEDSNSSGISDMASPLKDKKPATTSTPASSYSPSLPQTSYEEKIQNVSSSIWSFVSDVRSNVMSSLADEGSEVMYNLDTGSTISLDKTLTDRKADSEEAIEIINKDDQILPPTLSTRTKEKHLKIN